MKSLLQLLFLIIISPQEKNSLNPYSGGIDELSCYSSQNEKAEIKELTYYNRKCGYSIWLNYNQTKVKYFARKGNYDNTCSRFKDWKRMNRSIVSTSGGYMSQDFSKSIGFTIDHGIVINQKIDRNMDAIVIEYGGKISIFNIAERFWFNALGTYILLSDSKDRVKLINWAKNKEVSIFQTHLLAYKNSLKISSDKSARRALRKFLVLLSDKNGVEKISIFYLKSPEHLYTATNKIFDYLKSEQYNIHSFVNLDTGVNDVLELNPYYQNCNDKIIKGRTPINYATDLLIFYN